MSSYPLLLFIAKTFLKPSDYLKLSLVVALSLAIALVDISVLYLVSLTVGSLSNSFSHDSFLIVFGNYLSIPAAVVLILSLTLGSAAIKLLSISTQYRLSSSLSCRLATSVFENMISRDILWYKSISSSSTLSSFTKDLDQVSLLVQESYLLCVNLCIGLALTIYLALFISPNLSIIILFIITAYIQVYKATKKDIVNQTSRYRTSNAANIRIVQESIFGIRDIIVGSRQLDFTVMFGDNYLNYRRSIGRITFALGLSKIILEALLFVFIVSTLWATVYFPGFLPPSHTIPFLVGLFKLIQPLQGSFNCFGNIAQSLPSLKSLYCQGFLDNPEGDSTYHPAVNNTMFERLEFRNVSFSYPQSPNRAISDIDLTFYSSDRILVLGPSGSGKSTFIDLFMCLLSPTLGDIYHNGEPLSTSINRARWRSSLAFVPQEIFIREGSLLQIVLDDYTASSKSLLTPRLEKVYSALRTVELDSFVRKLPHGVDSTLGERASQISGGQRQRLALARAIMQERSILMLDEATSGLDKETESRILDRLLSNDAYRLIIVVSHNTSLCTKFSRIVRL